MNAIKITKLTMALGAVLVAASMTTNTAQASDTSKFTSQARARVLAEATAQPSAAGRVQQLRDALQGARVIDLETPVSHQGEQALADIRSEQLEKLKGRALEQIEESVKSARVVKRLPTRDRRTEEAIAAVRAEQLEDMRRGAVSQLATSMAYGHVVESVAYTQSGD